MSTAIIGVGNISRAVAAHLTEGGEAVVLAASTPAQAEQLARELGPPASAAGVAGAIERADAVIFAVWFDVLQELVRQNASRLAGKVVIDPSNPVAMDASGRFSRTLPDGVSAAGFAPVRAGGLDQAIRIEMFGDLHDYGGLNGRLLTAGQARALLAAARG